MQLQRRRLELDLSMDDLAAISGISRQQIGNIEKGHSVPSADTLLLLGKALSCRVIAEGGSYCIEAPNDE